MERLAGFSSVPLLDFRASESAVIRGLDSFGIYPKAIVAPGEGKKMDP